MSKLIQRFGLEADTSDKPQTDQPADSAKANETELVIYAKVTKPDGLREATHIETHEQLEATLKHGRIRVRKTSEPDGKVYFKQTIKKTHSSDGLANACVETNQVVDEDFFLGFKTVAEGLVNKTRYHFVSEKVQLSVDGESDVKTIELPRVVFEVDVFKKPDGTDSEWCKIDIEVDSVMTFIDQNYPELKDLNFSIKVSHLPFGPLDPFSNTDATDAQKVALDHLWNTEFKTRLNESVDAPADDKPAE